MLSGWNLGNCGIGGKKQPTFPVYVRVTCSAGRLHSISDQLLTQPLLFRVLAVA